MSRDSESESGAEYLAFLSGLLRTEAYSDMQLEHPEKTFQLHKAIVCSQSPVIEAALTGGFQEGATGTLKVDCSFDLDTVQRMVDFLYTQQYSVEPAADASKDGPSAPKRPKPSNFPVTKHTKKDLPAILKHLSVLEIADYYRLPCLETLVATNIESFLRKNWSADVFVSIARQGLEKVSEGPFVEMLARTAFKHVEELVEFEDFPKLTKNPTLMLMTLTAGAREVDRANKMIRQFDDCIEETRGGRYHCPECNEECNYFIEKMGFGFNARYSIECAECFPFSLP